MKQWKKITLSIIFGVILFAIGLMQNIGLAILCSGILFIAYHLIDMHDSQRRSTFNRYDREKYYDSTKRS